VLPNLIIIGAEKCGTSALYYYLHQHPEIAMSRRKELRFFNGSHWDKGLAWYESNFTNASVRVRGEASPQYTQHPRGSGTPRRMHAVVPEAKLVYLVRDPIDRIVSAYMSAYAMGREDRTLADAVIPSPTNRYVCVSSYFMQLEQYLPYFPLDQILVVTREDLLARRRPTLRRVFRFLDVDDAFDTRRFDRVRNPSSGKRRVEHQPRWLPGRVTPAATGRVPWALRARVKRIVYRPFSVPVERPAVDHDLRQALVGELKPDVDRLRQLTGQAFEQWSV
jgi:hypothetical protein